MRDWLQLPETARSRPITAPDDVAKVVFTRGHLHTAAQVEKTFERGQLSKLREAPRKSQPCYEDDF